MGELIKNYGKICYGEKEYNVELNGPVELEKGGIVHIQNKDIRIEMSQLEFYRMVCLMNLAQANLKRIKGDNLHE
jgi:hypothetical protein